MLNIHIIPALADNYIYLLHEPCSGETAAVDPAEAEPVLQALQQRGLQLNYVFNTHHHGDHVGANIELKQTTGCRIVGASADRARIPGIDIAVSEGDVLKLGDQPLKVLETPGHTLGHVAYYCSESQALFCGDTLFSMGCGRLFEGSAEQLYQSLQKLASLPAATRVYCAHEYTAANGRFALTLEPENPALQRRAAEVAGLRRQGLPTLPSTLADETACNPFLRTDSAAIRRAVVADAQTPAAEVFARIRRLKDEFR